MRVPGLIFGCKALAQAMVLKVYEQVVNVATLPGIVGASWCAARRCAVWQAQS